MARWGRAARAAVGGRLETYAVLSHSSALLSSLPCRATVAAPLQLCQQVSKALTRRRAPPPLSQHPLQPPPAPSAAQRGAQKAAMQVGMTRPGRLGDAPPAGSAPAASAAAAQQPPATVINQATQGHPVVVFSKVGCVRLGQPGGRRKRGGRQQRSATLAHAAVPACCSSPCAGHVPPLPQGQGGKQVVLDVACMPAVQAVSSALVDQRRSSDQSFTACLLPSPFTQAQVLSSAGVAAETVELDQRPDGVALQDELERRNGRRTVPQVGLRSSEKAVHVVERRLRRAVGRLRTLPGSPSRPRARARCLCAASSLGAPRSWSSW